VRGQYFSNPTPVTGQHLCDVARSTAEDVELALDAAHAAAPAWGRTSYAERANILNKIADRLEANLEAIAVIETIDNGKPVRETMAADLPLAIDHFRYFAGVLRAQEGGISEIDHDTIAYHFHEPLGVVGQIIPWNFPLLMATWKLAPALAAGNAVVLKPAEQTPVAIMAFAELVADLLPPGVLNVVQGFGVEAGKPLASSRRVAKIAFTGETTTGRLIMQYASENLIPVTLELGGKSPNIFFADVMRGTRAGRGGTRASSSGWTGARARHPAIPRYAWVTRALQGARARCPALPVIAPAPRARPVRRTPRASRRRRRCSATCRPAPASPG
jgi:aldehyde dehydrogenase